MTIDHSRPEFAETADLPAAAGSPPQLSHVEMAAATSLATTSTELENVFPESVAPGNDTAPGTTSRRPWLALAVLGVVQFMIVIDNTIVNVALPSIRHGLGFSESGLTWVVNGYALAAVGLVMLGGRIADMRGRRRIFQIGTVIFTAASLCSGLAWNQQSLLVGRFAQGVGEALAAPAAFAMVALLFQQESARAKAFGIWGGLAGFGATVGVIASGLLTELAGWRWIFLINVVPGIVAVLLIRPLVTESQVSQGRSRLDFVSAILLVCSAGGIVQGLIAVTQVPWSSPRAAVPFLAGIVCLGIFIILQSRKPEPMVPLRFFANRVRCAGYLAMLFLLGSSAALFFLTALLMQQVLGYSPIRNGLAWLPFCAAFMPGLFASFRVTKRFGYRTTLVTGMLVSAAGVALLARVGPGAGFAADLLPGLVLTAFGFGMANPALQQAVMHGVSEEDAGLASGVSGTVSQVSNVIGLAVFVTVCLGLARSHGAPQILTAAGFRAALSAAAVCLAVGGAFSAVVLPGRRPRRTSLSADGAGSRERTDP